MKKIYLLLLATVILGNACTIGLGTSFGLGGSGISIGTSASKNISLNNKKETNKNDEIKEIKKEEANISENIQNENTHANINESNVIKSENNKKENKENIINKSSKSIKEDNIKKRHKQERQN